MDLREENVTGRIKRTKEIYVDSFPKEDRMPFWFMLILSKMPSTEFLSFHDKEILCGFVYMATVKNLTFIMFLAVDKNLRSRGYGSCILDKIQSIHPDNKILISIERCDVDAGNKEQRLRRKKFYLNNGYAETGYLIELDKTKQEIIIKNGVFDKDEFSLFFKKYSNGTMKPKIWKSDS